MSVMLTFSLMLGSLGYKQQVLASSAIASQYAFYTADAALECLLYADQQQDLFALPATEPANPPPITCDGSFVPFSSSVLLYDAGVNWTIWERLSLDSGRRCADITVYKPAVGTGTTYLFSQAYDVSCATVSSPNGARFVSRGLNASY